MEISPLPVVDRTGACFPGTVKAILPCLAVLVILWFFWYLLAWFLIANTVVHGYYATKHPDLASIKSWLPSLRFFRGKTWTLFILPGVKIKNRPVRESGLLAALCYGVCHTAGIMLPNYFMQAEMRLFYLAEIVVSLVIFGALVVSVMGCSMESGSARADDALPDGEGEGADA